MLGLVVLILFRSLLSRGLDNLPLEQADHHLLLLNLIKVIFAQGRLPDRRTFILEADLFVFEVELL